MLLHCNHENGGCGLPGVEEITGRKCEKLAERIAGNRTLSRRGLNKGKGIMVIFRILKHGENGSIRTGSTKRRSGLWNHLIWSYG